MTSITVTLFLLYAASVFLILRSPAKGSIKKGSKNGWAIYLSFWASVPTVLVLRPLIMSAAVIAAQCDPSPALSECSLFGLDMADWHRSLSTARFSIFIIALPWVIAATCCTALVLLIKFFDSLLLARIKKNSGERP